MTNNTIVCKNALISSQYGVSYYFYAFVFRIILDYTYMKVIVPIYGYSGFKANPSLAWIIIGWIIFFIFLMFNYQVYLNWHNHFSQEVINLLFFLSFVPFTSMVSAGSFSVEFVFCNTIFWSMLYLFNLVLVCPRKPQKRIKLSIGEFQIDNRLINCIFLISSIVIIYVSGRYSHFRLNFSFSNVYALRSESVSFDIPQVLRYLFGWSCAINTILIAYYFRRRQYLLVIACVLLQVLSFGFNGSKSTLFFTLCALAFNLFPKLPLYRVNLSMEKALTLLVMVCATIYLITNNYYWISLLIRRVMFLPVQLESYYFDFFTTHTPDFFRGSFLRLFGLTTPYPNLSHIIGAEYFRSPAMGANNGLISDGMTNFGYLGVATTPLIISIMLRLFDWVSQGLDYSVFLAPAVYVASVWINSFQLTCFLTHGTLAIMIVFYLMTRPFDDENPLILR